MTALPIASTEMSSIIVLLLRLPSYSTRLPFSTVSFTHLPTQNIPIESAADTC